VELRSRYLGCLLGLACGDAVGTTVEFEARGSFPPVTDMTGGGPFGLAAGQWTDDTSMALCLAESLLACNGFDAGDQMTRYVRWWEEGYLSSTGRCFDIGGTTGSALERFRRSGEPYSGSTDPNSAGNGSLMRLAPVVLFYFPALEDVIEYSALSSRTTHAAPQAVECCQLFASILARALSGEPKAHVLAPEGFSPQSPKVAAIARGDYLRKSRDQVSGLGYCVASLEAALWCFHGTASFAAAVLEAANLGYDADTTAAITGQLAGTYYGVEAIPEGWLERLHMRAEIERLAERLYEVSTAG
jgi:ADP-ribosyl-[dinitrogen reductase] hydrolase